LASAGFDPTSGKWVTSDGTPVPFLPDEPGNSPPYELIVTEDKSDPHPIDGHTHYLIGGDSKVVEQIVEFYKAKGTPVPDGYAQAAADHAAAVDAANKEAADKKAAAAEAATKA